MSIAAIASAWLRRKVFQLCALQPLDAVSRQEEDEGRCDREKEDLGRVAVTMHRRKLSLIPWLGVLSLNVRRRCMADLGEWLAEHVTAGAACVALKRNAIVGGREPCSKELCSAQL